MFAQKMIPLTDEEEPEDYCDESESDAPCMRYNCTYFSVTPKLSNKSVYYTFLSPFIHTQCTLFHISCRVLLQFGVYSPQQYLRIDTALTFLKTSLNRIKTRAST